MADDKKKPFDGLLPHKPDESLLESFRYINSMPGKDVRGKLIDCFQLWFNISAETDVLKEIKDVVGDLHNSSLLIDDIEDNSKLRRGIPVAHSIFGIPTVINCANYVFFMALEKCHAWDNPVAMKVHQTVMRVWCWVCELVLTSVFFVVCMILLHQFTGFRGGTSQSA